MIGTRRSGNKYKEGKARRFFNLTQIFVILLLLGSIAWTFFLLQRHSKEPAQERSSVKPGAETLIIYIFRNTDPEALNNLIFFLQHGIAKDDEIRYLVALDPTLPEAEMPPLPVLPENAEFVIPPTCFEMGVVGWLLHKSGIVNVKSYKHFLWISSSTKGPFQPAYVTTAWHTAFTDRLTKDVKLVGSTISCTSLIIDKAQPPIEHPHVQTASAAATDRVGISLLKGIGALDCHNNWLDNIRYGEFAASAVLLNVGFSIDSLMLRYQGLDWRKKQNWKCNSMIDPRQEGTYDGASLNPLEVIFIRAEFSDLVLEKPTTAQASLYADWEHARGSIGNRSVQSNSWISSATRSYPTVMARPASCFDSEFYIMASPVEFADFTPEEAYAHFKQAGYREGRPYMFLC